MMKKINSDQLTKLLNKSEVINLELDIYDLNIEASFYYKDADIYDVSKKLDLKTFSDSEKELIKLFIIDLIYKREKELK